MASAFGHVAIPAMLYAGFRGKAINFRLFVLAAVCSILPDLDVLAFKFGISASSQWGHRGFTHSIAFSIGVALVVTTLHRLLKVKPFAVFLIAFLSCVSHGLLDAMTNGGPGVAFYWPFSTERIFFPFRPIAVSPIGISAFFTQRGLKVLISEAKWIFCPALIISLILTIIRCSYLKKDKQKFGKEPKER